MPETDLDAPLADVTVIDVCDLRGALAGRVLADLGASVTRIVAPGQLVPGPVADADRWRNRGKAVVSLDLDAPDGRARLDDLLAGAHVLVDDFGPSRAADLRLDLAAVGERHPHLVHVALSDLGATGPRSRWHLEALPALAASGALHATGFPSLHPTSVPGYLAHDCASVFGALAAVVGVYERHRGHPGIGFDISVQESSLSGLNPWSMIMPDYLGVNPFLPIEGKRNADGAYWVLPAADGWVRVVVGTMRQWAGFVSVCRNPDALTGEEWLQPGFRLANADVIRAVASECLIDRTRAELIVEAEAVGATMGSLHHLSEFVDHEQTVARAFFRRDDPSAPGLPVATRPWRFAAGPDPVEAPRPEPTSPPGRPSPRLLLDGVRVVEFGVAAVVPELCWVLSELGADVIKIESATRPDVLRQSGMGHLDRGFAYNAECRGRRSVALDLSTERGRDLALKLCARADIVAENHRGGVLDGLGLGYEAIAAENPAVVYVSSQGYGRGGPLGQMPAYGPLNAAFAGVTYLWNDPSGPYPCGPSLNHPDHIAGKLIASLVLAALRQRDISGRGRLIDVAQTETAAYLIGHLYLAAARAEIDPEPIGNRSPSQSPHGVYATAGDDRWVAIAVTDDDAFARFCAVTGLVPQPQWSTASGRLADEDAIDAWVAAWCSTQTGDAATSLLQRVGVSAMPVMGPFDHRADPHLEERGFLVTTVHPEVGPERHAGNPLRATRPVFRTAPSAPCLGADTVSVLQDDLGLSADEVDALIESGVCR